MNDNGGVEFTRTRVPACDGMVDNPPGKSSMRG
jgi:hypothetical protein